MALPSLTECAAALDRLAPALLIAAAGSALVLALAGVATLAMRRASAAARHEVWLMGFAGALLLPFVSAAVPGWALLPRAPVTPHVASSVQGGTKGPVFSSQSSAALSPAISKTEKETIMNATSERSQAGSPESQPTRSIPLAVWIGLCWAAGALAVLGRVAAGHLSLWSLGRRCRAVTRGSLFELLERLRNELGIRRRVDLINSPLRTMPMTWGVWRARILVPEQAAQWPAGQRRDVLLHELAHAKRRDCLTQLLAQVACALYWFNPLAWVASHRMQVERERACDDLVLNHGAAPGAYARHLLDSVASVPVLRLAGAAVAMARPSTLEERMRAILDGGLNRRAMTARGSLAAILLLSTALVPVAMLKAQQAPPDEPPAKDAPASKPHEGAAAPAAPAPTTRPASALPGRSRTVEGGGRTPSRFGFGGPPPGVGTGPTCTVDATLYDVRMPLDQIGRLDVAALAKSAESPDAFEKALAALGAAKPMYRADQSVRLSGDTINILAQTPIVTNNRVDAKGQTINSVQYRSTGAMFHVAGKAGGPGAGSAVDLDLTIDVAVPSSDGVAIGKDAKAPLFRNVTLSHKGPVQPGKPFVVVSVDGGAVDGEGKAVAYIGRITLGEPQMPTTGK